MKNSSTGDDLAKRREEHLKKVQENLTQGSDQPCLHDQCENCVGTGVKLDGQKCIHYISCPCPKCTPRY